MRSSVFRGRECGLEFEHAHLEQGLRLGEILESVLAEIDQLRPLGERSLDERSRGLREDDLAAVPRSPYPSSTMDVDSDVVAAASVPSPVCIPIRTRMTPSSGQGWPAIAV